MLERLQAVDGLERMAERTYRHLVASGEYAYRRFAKLVDDTVARKAEELGQGLRVPMRAVEARSITIRAARASLLEVPRQLCRVIRRSFSPDTPRSSPRICAAEITPAETKSIRPRSHV